MQQRMRSRRRESVQRAPFGDSREAPSGQEKAEIHSTQVVRKFSSCTASGSSDARQDRDQALHRGSIRQSNARTAHPVWTEPLKTLGTEQRNGALAKVAC
eukprot:scaffold492_cov257-Pinguiococcus_pyrenoidosus.AAC.12